MHWRRGPRRHRTPKSFAIEPAHRWRPAVRRRPRPRSGRERARAACFAATAYRAGTAPACRHRSIDIAAPRRRASDPMPAAGCRDRATPVPDAKRRSPPARQSARAPVATADSAKGRVTEPGYRVAAALVDQPRRHCWPPANSRSAQRHTLPCAHDGAAAVLRQRASADQWLWAVALTMPKLPFDFAARRMAQCPDSDESIGARSVQTTAAGAYFRSGLTSAAVSVSV